MLMPLRRQRVQQQHQANLASRWNLRPRYANSGRWVVLASTATPVHLHMELQNWRKELTSLGITRRSSANVSTRSSTARMALAVNSFITRCLTRRKRSLPKLILNSPPKIWSRRRRQLRHFPTLTSCNRRKSSLTKKSQIVVFRSSLRFLNHSAIARYQSSETQKTSLFWQKHSFDKFN